MKAGYELDDLERKELLATVRSEGFKVIQKIFEGEVDSLSVALLNTSHAKHDEVIAAHSLAKSAAVVYQKVIDRINRESEVYRFRKPETKVQPDITEPMLSDDISELANNLPDFNAFGGDSNFNEY